MKILLIGSILLMLALAIFGVWFCLYGGIVLIVTALQQNPVNAVSIAWGVVRVILIVLCMWLFVILGMFIFVGLTE